jgi:hypothetical protein
LGKLFEKIHPLSESNHILQNLKIHEGRTRPDHQKKVNLINKASRYSYIQLQAINQASNTSHVVVVVVVIIIIIIIIEQHAQDSDFVKHKYKCKCNCNSSAIIIIIIIIIVVGE